MKNLQIIFILAFWAIHSELQAYTAVVLDGINYELAWNYNTNEEQATVIRGGNATVYSGDIVIPSTVTYQNITYQVRSIGVEAFKDCKDIKSISLAKSIRNINNYAFYGCSGLRSLNIPPNITTIRCDGTFEGCSQLSSLTIEDSNETLHFIMSASSGAAFSTAPIESIYMGRNISYTVSSYSRPPFKNNTAIKNVTFGNNVTYLGDEIFKGCNNIVQIDIPSSVGSIGNDAFSYCINLTSVTIGKGVVSISKNPFRGCNNLSSMTVKEGNVNYDSRDNCNAIIETSTNELVVGCKNTTIPSTVTSIGYGAFNGCSGLTSVTIPSSVTSIGYYAFNGCTGLTSITIPEGVASIGNYAFSGCSGLTKVIVPDIAKWCKISFASDTSNPLYYIKHMYSDDNTEVTELVIPEGATEISDYAFVGCSNLMNVNIPSSVTSIGNNVFSGCTALTDVLLNSNAIASNTYSPSSSLKNIFGTQVKKYTLGDNITSIGNYAFSGCSGITSITIPSNVTSIGSSAFSGCSGLTSVTVPSSVTTIGSSAFSGCSELSTVTINSNDIVSKYYTSTSNISTIFGSQVKEYILGNEVTTIGSNAFYKCSNITGITIPSSVTTIGNSAFTGCSGLTNITIPESVTNIGSSAFSGCTGLTSITIPEGVTTICDYAFSGCTGLTSITIPESVTSISSSAFSSCSGLTSITIPEGVATIGSSAFSGCSGLTSITIPESVTSIGSSAFQGCTELTSIILPDNITSIGSGTYRSFLTSTKLYVNIGSKTLLTLWKNGYSSIYNAETGEIVSQPYLSKENSTQTTLEVKLYNKYKGYIYRCNDQILSSDIISFSELYPNCSKWIDIAISSGDVSYSISRGYSTNDINPIVTGNATNASSLSVNGNYAKGDAKVVKEIIKCNGKEFEGQSVSINGLTPNSSYDVEYVITVAYGSNNQYKTYSSTKTVKTKELTLTTEQPKVVSSGNVIVSATTNVDEEEKNVGFEWRRTDWTSDFASNSGSAVIFDNTMEGYIRNLNTDKLWKYRAYYISDAGVYYYGDWVGLDASNTSYFEPTVHTYADISTTGNVALIRGYVLNGTDKIKVQGFKYWKTANKGNSLDIDMEGDMQTTAIPADAITKTVDIVGSGQQLMNATLEGLDYDATYHCVAFATTTENETFYGEEQMFTTESITGIEGVKESAVGSSKAVTVVAYYDLNGKRLSAPQKGLNIIRMSDGTTRKVVR